MTIVSKGIIILFCIFILFALGSALYYLMVDRGSSERIVKALTWRIALSFIIFAFLFIAYAMGWLTPHQII